MKKRDSELEREDPIEDALRRSAAQVNPDPGFVERLALRLERARRTAPAGRTLRTSPPRQRWFALAGAVGALSLVIFLAMSLRKPTQTTS